MSLVIFDPLTGEYSLAGTTRESRPNEFLGGPEDRCAFCPGSEDRTPPEIARIANERGDWLARVFANKYPAVTPPDGMHEVIVDSPHHAHEVTRSGLALWRDRYTSALTFSPAAHPALFKNSGLHSGATILHPHTQLVVLRDRPTRMQAMLDCTREYRKKHASCLLCDERERARSHELAVYEDAHVAMFTRSEARFSSGLTVLPRECVASLASSDARVWQAVGDAVIRAASGLASFAPGGVPYNILVVSDAHAECDDFHWHIELVPRYFTLAGFELLTGNFIRTASAQESALRWRRMIAPPDGPV
jgi:UDPglucose--hexose-1-phosphate uridylyltransferase